VNFTHDDLARVTARTLLVFGDRDPLYPVSQAVEMYGALPHAALWVVPEAGHAPVFAAHAARFCDEALRFLKK
jgi:pimeloyl-ACP methyl ester carboxylesterase